MQMKQLRGNRVLSIWRGKCVPFVRNRYLIINAGTWAGTLRKIFLAQIVKADETEIKETWSKRAWTWNVVIHGSGWKIAQGKLKSKIKVKVVQGFEY